MVSTFNDPIYQRWLKHLGLGNDFSLPNTVTQAQQGSPITPPPGSSSPPARGSGPTPLTPPTTSISPPTKGGDYTPTLGSISDKYGGVGDQQGTPTSTASSPAQRGATPQALPQQQPQQSPASQGAVPTTAQASTSASASPVDQASGPTTSATGNKSLPNPNPNDKVDQAIFQTLFPDEDPNYYSYTQTLYTQYLDTYERQHPEYDPNATNSFDNLTNTGPESYSRWLLANQNNILFDAATTDQTIQNWLTTNGANLTDEQRAYVMANSGDLYRMYQETLLNNPNPAPFAYWLSRQNLGALLDPNNKNGLISFSDRAPDAYFSNWVDSQQGLTQEQKDQLKSQYNDLYAQYSTAKLQDFYGNPSWASFLKGVTAQGVLGKLPDAHPDITFQNWVMNSGLTPDQQQSLLSRYNALYAQFYVANQQNPNLKFSDFLGGIDPNKQLAFAPEQNTSNTYYQFVDNLKGLTPQMIQTLESRYTPVFSQYLTLHNQNPTQYSSFADYLAQNFNPLQVLQNIPQSAPFRGQQTFANRIRWSGY